MLQTKKRHRRQLFFIYLFSRSRLVNKLRPKCRSDALSVQDWIINSVAPREFSTHTHTHTHPKICVLKKEEEEEDRHVLSASREEDVGFQQTLVEERRAGESHAASPPPTSKVSGRQKDTRSCWKRSQSGIRTTHTSTHTQLALPCRSPHYIEALCKCSTRLFLYSFFLFLISFSLFLFKIRLIR